MRACVRACVCVRVCVWTSTHEEAAGQRLRSTPVEHAGRVQSGRVLDRRFDGYRLSDGRRVGHLRLEISRLLHVLGVDAVRNAAHLPVARRHRNNRLELARKQL